MSTTVTMKVLDFNLPMARFTLTDVTRARFGRK